jgi:hypothetical protein
MSHPWGILKIRVDEGKDLLLGKNVITHGKLSEEKRLMQSKIFGHGGKLWPFLVSFVLLCLNITEDPAFSIGGRTIFK